MRRLAGTFSHALLPPARSLPVSSPLVARSDAACALPRPSAIASAKLPNNTVSHSQTTIWIWNDSASPDRDVNSRTVSSVATTAVVNMTGFLTSALGASLRNASPSAGPASWAENIEGAAALAIIVSLEQLAGDHREMVGDRSEREAGQEGQAADDQDDADQQSDPQRTGGGE